MQNTMVVGGGWPLVQSGGRTAGEKVEEKRMVEVEKKRKHERKRIDDCSPKTVIDEGWR